MSDRRGSRKFDLSGLLGSDSEDDALGTVIESPFTPLRSEPARTRFSIALEETETEEEEEEDEDQTPQEIQRSFELGVDQTRLPGDTEMEADSEGDLPPNRSIDFGSEEEEEEEEEEEGEPAAAPFLAYIPSTSLSNFSQPMDEEEGEEDEQDSFRQDETEEDEEENEEDSFHQSYPSVASKAQTMRDVFFPFPHQTPTSKQEPAVVSSSRSRRLSGDLEDTSLSSLTPIRSTLPSTSSLGSRTVGSPMGDAVVPSSGPLNTLFPEKLSFPPRKRFLVGTGASVSLQESPDSGRKLQEPLVQYDLALVSQQVALEESVLYGALSGSADEPSIDFASTLSRSTCVGWGPGQLMAFSTPRDVSSEITLQSAVLFATGIENVSVMREQYEPLLQVHLAHNQFLDIGCHKGYCFAPLTSDEVQLKREDKVGLTNRAKKAIQEMARVSCQRTEHLAPYVKGQGNEDRTHAHKLSKQSMRTLQLIDALWSNADYTNMDRNHFLHFENSLYEAQEREALLQCRHSLSAWGQQSLDESVQDYQRRLDEFPHDEYMAKSILNFLAGRQLRQAVDVSLKEGEFCLATIIAQSCSIEMRDQMRAQIEEWESLLESEIKPNLSQLYRLLSGDVSKGFQTTGSPDDWLRALFEFFWYGENSNTEHYIFRALESYKGSELFRTHPPCLSKDAPVHHIQFQLMEYFCSGSHDIWSLVEPLSYSASPMEYSLGWLTLTLLSSLLQQPYHTREIVKQEDIDHFENKFHQLTVGFAAQLESVGMFEWAIYVLNHLPEQRIRSHAVQKVLERNSNQLSASEEIPGSPALKIQRFLVDSLRIPESALSLAKSCSDMNAVERLEMLLDAGMCDEAHSLFVEDIGPPSLLQFHTGQKRFLDSQYERVPDLLNRLSQMMKNKEGAYRIYFNFFATLLPGSFHQVPDELAKITDLVRSRLAELQKYPCSSRKGLER